MTTIFNHQLLPYAKTFLLAFGISYLITPFIGRLASLLRIFDMPAKNKLHEKPIPRLGGLAIFAGYITSLYITNSHDRLTAVIILGGIAILAIGFLDDIFRIPAIIKFLYICGVTFVCAKNGLAVRLFGDLFYLNFLVSLLWIAGVTSAFNAVDNMDGLASGLGMIASLTFFIIAVRTAQWEWAILASALCGALLGFLRYNFHPAKIFMGDSGSFFLGFTLACIGIRGEWSINAVKASAIPLLVLGVPVFDLLYIVIRRWIEGTTRGFINAITFCAKDHLSHRLISLGFNQRVSALLIYLIAICVSIGAIVLQNAPRWDAALLLLQFILVFITMTILINITKRL